MASELYFYDDDFAVFLLGLYIYAIELVVGGFLIAFALQDFHDANLAPEKDGDESFEHSKVGLVAQHALHGPVKTDVFVG